MFTAMCFVIKIYLAVKAAFVQRAFQIQGPEMEEEQRARHREMEPPRRAVQTGKLLIAGSPGIERAPGTR